MSEPIPYLNLLYLVLPLMMTAWVYFSWCGKKWELGYATLRMVGQLLVIGYCLIFLFDNDSTWIGGGILLTMIVMSSLIAVRPIKQEKVLIPTLCAISISGTVTLGLVILGVLDLSPFYQPRVVIPIAGMIYSNGMNTVSLAGERYFTERVNGKSHTAARAQAFQAALIPNINSFLAVGLVSLPGMMTGQILSGVSPLIAVRYQIMVMAMILGSAGLAAWIFLLIIGRTESAKEKDSNP